MISIDFSVYEKLETYDVITHTNPYSSSKTERFHPESLYSEQIFGPVKNFNCQCGKTFGKANEGKRCEYCGVLCTSNSLRSKTFAKIELPQNIFVVNPNFEGTLKQIFGPFAIKNILNVKKINENREQPYYYSLEKLKLIKESKLKETEKKIPMEIYDLTSLKELFDLMMENEETRKILESKVFEPQVLKYFFLNDIIVIPPESRPIIKINNAKTVVHPITSLYQKLINSKKNISDSLYQKESEIFGYTIYKYQEKINEIYSKIGEQNFKNKNSYIRESLAGKTIEFSQRAVIVPNPALKPYAIGLPIESVKKLFFPEFLKFLYNKFDTNDIDGTDITVIDFLQNIYNIVDINEKISIPDELFKEFLEKYMSEFRLFIERQPTLWRYNTVGVLLERTYGENDLFLDKEEEG